MTAARLLSEIGLLSLLIVGPGCYKQDILESNKKIDNLAARVERIETEFSIGKAEVYVATSNLIVYSEPNENPNYVNAKARSGAIFRRSSDLTKTIGLVPVEFPCGSELISGYVRAESLKKEMIDLGAFMRLGNTNPIEFQWQYVVSRKLQENSLKRVGVAIFNRAKLPPRSIDDVFDSVYGRLTNTGLTIKRVAAEGDDSQPTLWKHADIEVVMNVILDDQRMRIRLIKYDGTVLYVSVLAYRPIDSL